MPEWFELSGSDGDIAVSTRVRLARNLKNLPFAAKMTDQDAEKVIAAVSRPIMENPVFAGRFKLKKYGSAPSGELAALAERHLISKEFAAARNTRALLLSDDEGISVMINEEDHIRLQVLGSGLCLEKCLETAVRLDTVIDEGLGNELGGYAFDNKLGYLTNCPTNLGTGMRASVMLHLPSLAASGQARSLAKTASQFGLAVRGFYGEGSGASGDIFQISNRVTLGYTESELVERLGEAVSNIIREERASRKAEYEAAPEAAEDTAHRAAALLSSARRMSTEEAMRLLSAYRAGISSGILKGDITSVNSLLWKIQPASVGGTNAAERDVMRAKLLRKEIHYE